MLIPSSSTIVSPIGLALPLLFVAHDLRTARRVHPATVWGGLAYYVSSIGAFMVSTTGIGHALITLLE